MLHPELQINSRKERDRPITGTSFKDTDGRRNKERQRQIRAKAEAEAKGRVAGGLDCHTKAAIGLWLAQVCWLLSSRATP